MYYLQHYGKLGTFKWTPEKSKATEEKKRKILDRTKFQSNALERII